MSYMTAMNIPKPHLLLILVLITSIAAVAQTRPANDKRFAEQLPAFERFVQQQMEADKTVGITIGFFKDDFTWVRGYGYSDLENKIPTQAESAYRIASISKPMTAVAVLQLVEQGKIGLDDEIQKYVPYFPKKKYPITVRELLGHLGGVRHYSENEVLNREHKSTRQTVDLFSASDLLAEPGTRFSYSGPGFALLGAAIEKASGKSYADYMRENVWATLGMNDTRLDDPFDVIPNRVRGYQLVNGKIKNSEHIDTSSRFASGATRSTVIDLLKFARGMCQGKLLKPETFDSMWTPLTLKNGRSTTYGLGWWTEPTNGRLVAWHGGSLMETQAALFVFPRENFAIAALMNFEGAVPYPYTDRLYELIRDEPLRINSYATAADDRIVLSGMADAFNYGMRYFEQYQKPLTKDPKELVDAFAYFNAIPGSAQKKDLVAKGHHPIANQAFVKMTSSMAARLKAADPKRFDEYFRRGSIPFFADYISLYTKDPTIPRGLRFDVDFEKRVAAWNSDWSRTWTGQTRRLELSSATDFKKLEPALSALFKRSVVYPSFAPKLEALTDFFVQSGNAKRALDAATLAGALYPALPSTQLELGLAYILANDKEKAFQAFQKAKDLDALEASASTLNRYAYFLVAQERSDAAIRVLEIATDLYPNDANLYDSIGDLAAKSGQKDRAIRAYERALEIDPNYENAAGAKAALRQLRQQ